MDWACGILFGVGLALACSDGAWFPVLNLLGMGMVAVVAMVVTVE